MKGSEADRHANSLKLLPGVAICGALAGLALWLAEIPLVKDRLHLGALLLVILIGMVVRSVVHLPEWSVKGIEAAQRPILRWGVALLGFKLSLSQLVEVGLPALAVVIISTGAALAFGIWCAKQLGIGQKMGSLLSVGGSICGASAIVAADAVVQGQRKDVAASLGVITLMGTVGILVYPGLAHLLRMDPILYGVWDGASLHEMAQVVAAGQAYGDEALRTATVVKLARICLLAPVVLYLSWSFSRKRESIGAKVPLVPWFLVAFLAFTVINSAGWLSMSTVDLLLKIGLWVLAIGMAGVGLNTGFKDLRDAGGKAVLLGALQWVFLALLSLGLAYAANIAG